jgi:hypothetical protein
MYGAVLSAPPPTHLFLLFTCQRAAAISGTANTTVWRGAGYTQSPEALSNPFRGFFAISADASSEAGHEASKWLMPHRFQVPSSLR